MHEPETIVAVATPSGPGGLGVVRLSGPQALEIARRLLTGDLLRPPVTSHRAALCLLRWPERPGAGEMMAQGVEAPSPGTALDEALVLPLLAPGSYTGDDTVEFHCHGGTVIARLVAAACRAAGARAAGPGEFTRRAFLNGRLRLEQAEAVADLVGAEHVLGARAALAQLRGGLQRELAAVESPLREMLAGLEGAMEFSDDEDDPGPGSDAVTAAVAEARRSVEHLLSLGPAGRRLREGVQVVLTGPPNAGKSSLLNALVGRDRAIVDAAPGTTRDVVTARCSRGGLLYVLHDTAGLRDRGGRVENLGMTRAREELAAADVILALQAVAETALDQEWLNAWREQSAVITILTKSDLLPGSPPAGLDEVTSSVTGAGLESLWSAIETVAADRRVQAAAELGVVLNDRHLDRLGRCRDRLGELERDLANGPVAAEISAAALAGILQELGEITGRVFSEKLLGEIFARFCVGK